MKAWFNISSETYVLLKKNIDAEKLTKKFPSMVKQNLGEDYKEGGYMITLQPITKIHLDTSIPAGIEPISNPKYSYILLTIGILFFLLPVSILLHFRLAGPQQELWKLAFGKC
jgi:hypothetical protein